MVRCIIGQLHPIASSPDGSDVLNALASVALQASNLQGSNVWILFSQPVRQRK